MELAAAAAATHAAPSKAKARFMPASELAAPADQASTRSKRTCRGSLVSAFARGSSKPDAAAPSSPASSSSSSPPRGSSDGSRSKHRLPTPGKERGRSQTSPPGARGKTGARRSPSLTGSCCRLSGVWTRRGSGAAGGGDGRKNSLMPGDAMRRKMSISRKSTLLDTMIIGGGNRKADLADLDVHAVVDAARATADAEHLRPHGTPWFLISPHGRRVALWDTFTSFVLLFISIFTPLEVAFLETATHPLEPLFVFARLVDLIFVVDMAVQFVTMIPKEGGGGKLETSWRVIAYSYVHPLRGWFLLDLSALGASSFDFLPLAQGTGQKSELSAFRAVRILRLVKLARLLKASQRLKEWSVKVAMPHSTLTIVSSWIECLFVMHWSARRAHASHRQECTFPCCCCCRRRRCRRRH
jgi:hypothetical protein